MTTGTGFLRSSMGLHRRLIAALNELLSQQQLTYGLWIVMVYIHDREQATLVEIANHYGVEKPVITRRVQRLRELALLDCTPGQDKRAKVLCLSTEGQQCYRRCRQLIDQFEARLLAPLPDTQREALLSALPLLQASLLSLKD